MHNSKITRKSRPQKQVLVGKIYADWCGHCVALKPEWDKMKRFIKMNMGRMLKNVQVEFVEIGDTNANKKAGKTVDNMIEEFNTKHLVQYTEKLASDGFPTVFKLCDGKLEYYKEPNRTAEAMYKWAMSGCVNEDGNVLQMGGSYRGKTSRRSKSARNKRRGTRKSGFLNWFW